MRITALLLLAFVVTSTTHAISADKALRKVKYTAYTGTQQDWPRSPDRVTAIEIARDGVPIYNKLPDRPYEVLGTVIATGDLQTKHAAQAATAVGADAILVVGDKAFQDAGISLEPKYLKNADVPDPNAATPVRRMDRPDLVKGTDTHPTIRVNVFQGIFIRWKAR